MEYDQCVIPAVHAQADSGIMNLLVKASPKKNEKTQTSCFP